MSKQFYASERRRQSGEFAKEMKAASLIVRKVGKGLNSHLIIAGRGLRVAFLPVSHKWYDGDLKGQGIPDLKKAFGFPAN